jgi:hypothetical protein
VAGGSDSDVVVGLVNLLDAVTLHQRRPNTLVHRQNHTVRGSDADAGCAAFDRFAGVLDLIEATVRREDGNPAVVGLLL